MHDGGDLHILYCSEIHVSKYESKQSINWKLGIQSSQNPPTDATPCFQNWFSKSSLSARTRSPSSGNFWTEKLKGYSGGKSWLNKLFNSKEWSGHGRQFVTPCTFVWNMNMLHSRSGSFVKYFDRLPSPSRSHHPSALQFSSVPVEIPVPYMP